MRTRLPLLLIALALSGCGPLFFVELEFPRLCELRKDALFELSGPPIPVAYSDSLEFDIPAGLPADPMEAWGQVLEVQVTAAPGTLDFVEEARLVLRQAEEAPGVEVVRYQSPGTPGATVLQAGGERFDLLPFFQTRKVFGRLELSGTLPPEPFTAEVHSCVYLRARYDW